MHAFFGGTMPLIIELSAEKTGLLNRPRMAIAGFMCRIRGTNGPHKILAGKEDVFYCVCVCADRSAKRKRCSCTIFMKQANLS